MDAREVIARVLRETLMGSDDLAGSLHQADTILAAIAAYGMVLVPSKPTPAMLKAAWTTFRGDRIGPLLGPGPGFKEAMIAMLAAAPTTGGEE